MPHPTVHVAQDPIAVLGFAGEGIGREGYRCHTQVQRVIAGHVVVVAEVIEHLGKAVFAVLGVKAPRHLDGVARPIQRGGLAQHGAPAAVEHAANDVVFRVVIGRLRVFIHVEAGITPDALLVTGVGRIAQRLQDEGRDPFSVVHPIEHHGEFLVVHAFPRHGHVLGLGLGILLQVAVPAVLVHGQDAIRRPERVEHGPVEQVFASVIRAVVAAPTGNAEQVAPFVKILGIERRARLFLRAQEFPLQQRPMRRGHVRRQVY